MTLSEFETPNLQRLDYVVYIGVSAKTCPSFLLCRDRVNKGVFIH